MKNRIGDDGGFRGASPLIDFGEGTLTFDQLRTYARTAAELRYATLSANDHLVWRRPWLDGPTALTSVIEHTGTMALATSIALVAVRHPVVVGKQAHELAARLPVGPPDHCVELLRSYATAGAQQILLWPIHDPINQLRKFDELVRPSVG